MRRVLRVSGLDLAMEIDEMRDDVLVRTTPRSRLALSRRCAGYDILDSPPDGAFDRLTGLAARTCGTPMAIVSIVDTDRIWFKSRYGLVIPLTTSDGRDLGTLRVLDCEPRQMSEQQVADVTDRARIVVDELELRLSAQQRVSVEEERRRDAEALAHVLQESLLPLSLPDVAGPAGRPPLRSNLNHAIRVRHLPLTTSKSRFGPHLPSLSGTLADENDSTSV